MADRQINGGRLLSGEEREELEGVVADYRGDHLTEEECRTCKVLAGLLARDVDAAGSPDEPDADRLSYAELETHAAALQAQVDSLKASLSAPTEGLPEGARWDGDEVIMPSGCRVCSDSIGVAINWDGDGVSISSDLARAINAVLARKGAR